jgi:hypothetical protein
VFYLRGLLQWGGELTPLSLCTAKKRKKGDDGDKKGGANLKRVKVEGGDGGVVTSDVRSRAAQFLDGIAGGGTKVKAESKTFVKPRRDLPV